MKSENKPILAMPKELAGIFAMWAVRQSPYLVPDYLSSGIMQFLAEFACTEPVLSWSNEAELKVAVTQAIQTSPVCLGWNERKNGRQGIGFSSRYGQPESDDDFIDIDALRMNICRTILESQE